MQESLCARRGLRLGLCCNCNCATPKAPVVPAPALPPGIVMGHTQATSQSCISTRHSQPCSPCPLQTIHDQVMGLGFDACGVDLFTVDSQFSHNRGVTVLVTGALTFMVGCPCCLGG